MKDNRMDEQWLVQQLAQPPELGAGPFFEVLYARIRREERVRRLVFAVAGLLSLLLVLAEFPVRFITDYTEQLGALGSLTENLVQSLMNVDLASLTVQPATLVSVIAILAAISMLLSVQLRNW